MATPAVGWSSAIPPQSAESAEDFDFPLRRRSSSLSFSRSPSMPTSALMGALNGTADVSKGFLRRSRSSSFAGAPSLREIEVPGAPASKRPRKESELSERYINNVLVSVQRASCESPLPEDPPASEDGSVVSEDDPIPLEYDWTFWFDQGLPKGASKNDYEGCVKSIATFSTVHEFWRLWHAITETLKDLEYYNLRLFKSHIRPMWEDEENRAGGKFVLVVKEKSEILRFWTELVLSLIGEQVPFSDKVCGGVLSVRNVESVVSSVSLWMSVKEPPVLVQKVSSALKELCALPDGRSFGHYPHTTSLAFAHRQKSHVVHSVSKKDCNEEEEEDTESVHSATSQSKEFGDVPPSETPRRHRRRGGKRWRRMKKRDEEGRTSAAGTVDSAASEDPEGNLGAEHELPASSDASAPFGRMGKLSPFSGLETSNKLTVPSPPRRFEWGSDEDNEELSKWMETEEPLWELPPGQQPGMGLNPKFRMTSLATAREENDGAPSASLALGVFGGKETQVTSSGMLLSPLSSPNAEKETRSQTGLELGSPPVRLSPNVTKSRSLSSGEATPVLVVEEDGAIDVEEISYPAGFRVPRRVKKFNERLRVKEESSGGVLQRIVHPDGRVLRMEPTVLDYFVNEGAITADSAVSDIGGGRASPGWTSQEERADLDPRLSGSGESGGRRRRPRKRRKRGGGTEEVKNPSWIRRPVLWIAVVVGIAVAVDLLLHLMRS